MGNAFLNCSYCTYVNPYCSCYFQQCYRGLAILQIPQLDKGSQKLLFVIPTLSCAVLLINGIMPP